MKIKNTYDVESMLKMFISSSALQLSLQLGLYYDLHENPMSINEISEQYQLPKHRAVSWILLLQELDLIEETSGKFHPTRIAEIAILQPYSKESWILLANEAHERYLIGNKLAKYISHPQSVLEDQDVEFPDWLGNLKTNSAYAKDFTIMLYERHFNFAEEFSKYYDLTGVKKILDIGGGSGVMSIAMLKQNPNLKVVVVDLENVCKVGEELSENAGVANRISYQPIDFIKEPIPTGFDAILLCDVIGIPTSDFHEKLKKSLNKGGRVIFLNNLDEEGSWLNYEGMNIDFIKKNNNFLSALCTPSMKQNSVQDLKLSLTEHGYSNVEHQIMENGQLIVQGFRL